MRREGQLRHNLQAIMARADGNDGRDARCHGRHRPADPRHGAAAGRRHPVSTGRPLRSQWPLANGGRVFCRHGRAATRGRGPLAAASLVWLVQYYSSGEAAWRNRPRSRSTSGKPRPRLRWSTRRRGTCVRRPSRPLHVQSGAGLASEMRASGGRLEKGGRLCQTTRDVTTGAVGEPMARFPLAAAQRGKRGCRGRPILDYAAPPAALTTPGGRVPRANFGCSTAKASRPKSCGPRPGRGQASTRRPA